MPTRKLAALPLALTLIGLAACTTEATVPGDELAELAEDALEEETGARPDIDCGDDSIAVSQDKEVDCMATSTETGDEYATTVTFTSVDGNEYEISVEVAAEPNGAESDDSAEAPSDETSEPPTDQAGLEIPAERLAEATADALEPQLGSRPEIDCGTDINIVIYVDRPITCELTDSATGSVYEVTNTITNIDGQQFEFDIQVSDTPK